MIRVDGEVGMVAFVGEEWRNACGSTGSVVVSELRERKELRPIVLLVVAINVEILL